MYKRFLSICLVSFLLPAFAHAEYFIIKDYAVNVTFDDTGEALFEETITVEFSQPRHGIFRFIPIRSRVDGKRVDRIIRDIEVEGFKFSTSKENNNIVFKIGDADVYVSGTQTYHIKYRVVNPLNFFEDHAEFYWDLLGISWPVTIDHASFRIQMPPKVNLSSDDVRCYTGAEGTQGQDLTYQVFPTAVTGETTRRFMPGEGLTVALRLPEGTFTPMSGWSYFLMRHGLLFAPLGFLLLGALGFIQSRNKRESIMTEYFPPDGISPAVAGGFVDHSVDNHDVLSLIPHLGNLGFLRLEAGEKKGLFGKQNITFHKLKEADGSLLPFEQQFFSALFSYGNAVTLSSLKDKFYTSLAAVRSSVKQWIYDQGWYEASQKRMGCITGIGAFIAIGWGAFAIFGRQNMDGIALIVTGVILLIIASKFNKRTASGNETYRKLEGFKRFVAKAERPVIERLMKEDPLYYDKTMPYALAFGYLKQWNKQFDGLLSQPPSWYSTPYLHSSGMQSWDTFSTSFPSEMNDIGSVFSSAPSSSGSGGGGGGFSGGGSGGGGGGSW